MSWKLKLEELECNKDGKAAILLLKKVLSEDKDNMDAYIRVIYLIHDILLGEPEYKYTDQEEDGLEELLVDYFQISYEKFSDNAEYLFFIGERLPIAEWYFGLNDDEKPMEQRLSSQMRKKAFDKEPTNFLYEWSYRLSSLDKVKAFELTKQLLHDNIKISWLKSKGFLGKYILEGIQTCYSMYK